MLFAVVDVRLKGALRVRGSVTVSVAGVLKARRARR